MGRIFLPDRSSTGTWLIHRDECRYQWFSKDWAEQIELCQNIRDTQNKSTQLIKQRRRKEKTIIVVKIELSLVISTEKSFHYWEEIFCPDRMVVPVHYGDIKHLFLALWLDSSLSGSLPQQVKHNSKLTEMLKWDFTNNQNDYCSFIFFYIFTEQNLFPSWEEMLSCSFLSINLFLLISFSPFSLILMQSSSAFNLLK